MEKNQIEAIAGIISGLQIAIILLVDQLAVKGSLSKEELLASVRASAKESLVIPDNAAIAHMLRQFADNLENSTANTLKQQFGDLLH